MADNKTILGLDATASAATTDHIVIDKAGVTYRMTVANFNTLVGTSFTGVPVAVRIATTADGTLATAYANGQTVDGVALSTGDRILLKNQSDASENGVWIVTSGAPTRATDMDDDDELQLGMIVAVAAGTANAQSIWQLTTAGPYVVGTTALTWTQTVVAQQTHALDDLSNVTAPTPSTDDHLKWNGTAWINEAAPIPVTEWKAPVVAATTAAGTLASDFENGDTIDGVVLATGERILIMDQATASENGIYTVEASGAPTRATDNDVASEFEYGFVVAVIEGTANANTSHQFTKAGTIIVDTTDIDFTALAAGGGSSTFLGLTDSPANYTDAGNKLVGVNAAATATEFVAAPAGVALPFSGALVTLAADETAANYTSQTAIPFDSETYDVGGWHNNTTNNTRLTVPSGVTKVRLSGAVYVQAMSAGQSMSLSIMKNNSADVIGAPEFIGDSNGTGGSKFIHSAVVEVVPGDYFELKYTHETDTSINIFATRTHFSIEAVEQAAPSVTPRGALVHLVADETAANYTTAAAIQFDKEAYDTDTIHDNTTNNTRLTVPAGVTHVRLSGSALVTSLTAGDTVTLAIYKGGTVDWPGSPHQYSDTGSSSIGVNVTTGVIEVVEGDYFELFLDTQADTSVTVNNDRTWFALEVVGPLVVGATETAAGQPFKGALVKKAADQTAANYTTAAAIAFDGETYDIGGFHDNTTNNTRLTVPAGVTKARVAAHVVIGGSSFTANEYATLTIRQNGNLAFDGVGQLSTEESTTEARIQAQTAVLEVNEGDYFEAWLRLETDTSVTVTALQTWFCIEAVESIAPSVTPRGAMVTLAAEDTAANYSSATVIPFDAEVYDTDDIHDNTTNNTRLTVPAGVTHIRLSAGVSVSALTADMYCMLQVGKSTSYDWAGMPQSTTEAGRGERRITLSSGVLEVVEGDYFELRLLIETDTSVTIEDDTTWFSMEIVTNAVVPMGASRGALVHKAADETAANYSAATAIPWTAEDYDTDSIHDNTTNNSRLTVPSGVSKVKLSGQVQIGGGTMTINEYNQADIRKNNSADYIGATQQVTDTGNSNPGVNLATPILRVTPGDYFELFFRTETDTSITLDNDRSWFAMEIVE